MKTFLFILLTLKATIGISQNFEIYVSDAGNFSSPPWQILKFDENGQNGTVFINNNLNWPQDILFLEDSNVVLISNLGSNRITRHNATTGAFISNFATNIGGPTRMKIGTDGYLYVLQWTGNGKVWRYNLNGTFVDEFTATGVPQSIGMDWDANGNLYVSSYTGKYVKKFDTNGADMGFYINANLLGPTNIWFDNNGDLLVADYNGTSVKRFDSSGNFVNNFLTGLSQCEGVDFFPDGNILIGNGGTGSVKLFNSSGTYLQDLIPPGSLNLLKPNVVTLRPVTNVFLQESVEEQVVVLNPSIGVEFYIAQEFRDKIKTISIFNSAGKLVKEESFMSELQTLNLHKFNNGVYFVRIDLLNGTEIVQKIVVKK